MTGVSVEVKPVHVTATVKAAAVLVETGTPVIRIKHRQIQAYTGHGYVKTTAYTATGVKLTVEKSGTYDISWAGWRSTTSGTSGSRLYVNGAAHGAAVQTFTNTGHFLRAA